MALSTGVLLAVGGISGGNEWLHGHQDAALRIGLATTVAAVIFAGIEQIPGGGQEFAVGVATIALIGVLLGSFTPGVPSPAAQILDFMGFGK